MDAIGTGSSPEGEWRKQGEASRGVSLISRVGAWISANRSILGILAIVAVLAIAAIALRNLTAEVRYDAVMAAFDATGTTSIALAVLFTLISFVGLTFYDVGALSYIGRKLSYGAVAATAFCAYAVGNTAGFGPLSGGAIRYRGYSRLGLSPEEIAKVIAFVTLAFGLGLATLACLGILAVGPELAPQLGLSPLLLQAIAFVGLLPVAALLVAGRSGRPLRFGRFAVRLPGSALIVRQFLATAVDVGASAAVLYVLLPPGEIGFASFACIYAVAIGIGVLSHVPAGLGVFETVIVAALGRTVDVDQVLGALVLYRVIYYLLPLLCAAVFVSLAELRGALAGRMGTEVRSAGRRLAPPVLATLALLLGMMLILSSVTPTPTERLDALQAFVPLFIVEGAHFLTSLLGLALLVMARGLSQRLDGAWLGTILVTLATIVMSLVQAIAIHEAALLVFFALALAASRREFDRPASMLRQALTGPRLAAITTICVSAVIVLFFVYRDVDYSHELWWQFEFASEAPRSLRAMLGITIFASAVAMWSLVRPAVGRVAPPSAPELARAVAIVGTQDDADGNLVRSGDKSLLFSEDGRAFVMYARRNRSMIALFDPIGARDAWPALIWQFIEMSRANGCRAVFYQVGPDALSLYADAGMRAFRLGELAMIDLARFDLAGGKRAGLRQAKARGQRDGLTFAIVDTADVPSTYGEIAAVSDAWLAGHRTGEKAFSLGAFDRDYVCSQPVAVLRREGRIVAFANLLVTATGVEASVDLMRFHPEAPGGAMDFLFVQLLEHLKAQGFRRFNMGMAPLSGMSGRHHAPIWDRIGTALFEHGEKYYNFKGLRAFKAKFHPDWRPRYMTTSGAISPALALVDATLLIGGGLKRVVRR
ncbi:bifunctional lysylphosphatidylglycerol flippase/synthetase MprF [Aureimonas glaciei]|nr:bifunctional lysylphosphatidylglycerol flippase/synthetase MprF [Aureimonas glaciei]